MTDVVVVTPPACHLCEDALEALAGLSKELLPLSVREVDMAATSSRSSGTRIRRVRAAPTIPLEAGVKRLPVTGEDGRLVGIVSRRDLLRPFLRSDEELPR